MDLQRGKLCSRLFEWTLGLVKIWLLLNYDLRLYFNFLFNLGLIGNRVFLLWLRFFAHLRFLALEGEALLLARLKLNIGLTVHFSSLSNLLFLWWALHSLLADLLISTLNENG